MKARPSDCDLVLAALRERPYERRDLRDHLGIADNYMRAAVEELRAGGVLLVHDGEHYRLAETMEEYRAWRAYHWSRASRMIEQIRRMDETAMRTWPEQMTLEAA